MADIFVNWQKNASDGSWHRLRGLSVRKIFGYGVYLIWHSGFEPRVVYVGRGLIASRLLEHQRSNSILKYEAEGILLTSWGNVDQELSKGVERYLIDTYRPIENELKPTARPIAANFAGKVTVLRSLAILQGLDEFWHSSLFLGLIKLLTHIETVAKHRCLGKVQQKFRSRRG